jgi:glycosyltransferase involved in cell wall biosynthesis
MKKIIFFIESLEGGGAEKSLTELVETLDKNKFDITVITESNSEVYTQRVRDACKLKCLTKKCSRKNILRYNFNRLVFRFINTAPKRIVHRLLIGNRYDVEISYCEGIATKLIASSNNKSSKKIAFVHTDMQNNHWSAIHYKGLEEEMDCYKKFNSISCVSESVAVAFRHTFGTTKPVLVNHNPINIDAIKIKAQEPVVKNTADYTRIITVGRLTAVKAFDRLLRIAKQLKEDGYLFELLILGKGEQEQALKQYINENNLSDCVKLLGFQPNPYKFIAKSDFFVCSSLAEGFNTAVVECIVLETPVITTDCSGMKDAFGENSCGIICENNEDALLHAIKNVIDNPDSLLAFSNSCYERSSYFDIKKCVGKIEQLF